MSEPELLLATRRFDVVRLKYQTSDGVEHALETIRHPGAVAILPLLPHDQICLIRNFRVAVRQTLIELPAGTREPGETPLDTAHRELEEETGYLRLMDGASGRDPDVPWHPARANVPVPWRPV